MTLPALLFGILVSTLMGAAVHLIFGGPVWKLVLFIFLAWIGFWLGHYLGKTMGLTFLMVGPLYFGSALVLAAIFLLIGYWLSRVELS
jgi:hypothetical protein